MPTLWDGCARNSHLSAQEEEAHERDIPGGEAIVNGDAEAGGQALALAHGPGLDDVEDAEEKEDSRAAQDRISGEENFGGGHRAQAEVFTNNPGQKADGQGDDFIEDDGT